MLVGFCKPDLLFTKILNFLTFTILTNKSWHYKCRLARHYPKYPKILAIFKTIPPLKPSFKGILKKDEFYPYG